MIQSRDSKDHLRTAVIAFGAGALASLISGTMTSGLAAAYALVSIWVWGIVARFGGDTLANERWLLVLLTAVPHGLIFAMVIVLGRVAAPKLKESEMGGNLFLVAAVLYGLLLSVLFPVTP